MNQESRLGEFEALVLAAVVRAGGHANGAAVYEQMVETAEQQISLAAVHVTLRRLEEKHLLTSVTSTPSDRGGRPRRFYKATVHGLQALTAFRDLWRRAFRGLTLPDGTAS